MSCIFSEYVFLVIVTVYLQDDLDETVRTWNRHLIRPSHNAHSPSGRPNVLYQLPVLYDTIDYMCEVDPEDVVICKDECLFREPIPRDRDVYDMCNIIMNENDLEFPQAPDTAVELYLELRRLLNNLLD